MFVVVLLVLLIGVSYAVYRYTFTGSLNILNKEMIELELLEDTNEVINLTNALPISDTKGIEEEQTFNFAVTTRTEATTDIYYNLKIEKLNVDSGYTSLADEDIRVYLTDYNNKALIAPIKISDLNNYTFYKTYNSHNKDANEVTTKYKLKIWIDFDVDASSWNENTRLQYKFKIGVEGEEYNSDEVNLSNKVIPEGAYYVGLTVDMETETVTPTLYDEIPETPNEYDMYIYGDYMYIYGLEGMEGWIVALATEQYLSQFGLTELIPDYQPTLKNKITYGPILENINEEPVIAMNNTFADCTSLVDPPVIPKSVMITQSTFTGCISLKSETNIYSVSTDGVETGNTLESITNYTTDYKSLNKTFFLKHNIGSLGRVESQEVCYILNGNKYCLKGGEVYNEETETYISPHHETNKATLLESFGEENCSVNSNDVYCSTSGLKAYAYDGGNVYANDDSSYCYVNPDGLAYCTE